MNTNSKTANVMDNTTITNQCRTGNEDTGISEDEFYANKKPKPHCGFQQRLTLP